MLSRRVRASVIGALLLGGVLALGGCSSDPPYHEGDCVLLSSDSPVQPVDCHDLHAARIVRMTDAPGFHDCAGLPPGTVQYSFVSANEADYGMCIEPPAVPGP